MLLDPILPVTLTKDQILPSLDARERKEAKSGVGSELPRKAVRQGWPTQVGCIMKREVKEEKEIKDDRQKKSNDLAGEKKAKDEDLVVNECRLIDKVSEGV
ncbi:hypothetical protein TNIN_174411 [Trichonephila inaurata madagascariensis]|uniref:Uncharacterized protein n=1 Tax=Trichonephila inaurata madagascariensis TaxID=2747483 RepID=A0A8X7CTQ5_9ARAC|nr:hypothetical protein TNIN_174411 [Trichonephila inaurata madagascariensis]